MWKTRIVSFIQMRWSKLNHKKKPNNLKKNSYEYGCIVTVAIFHNVKKISVAIFHNVLRYRHNVYHVAISQKKMFTVFYYLPFYHSMHRLLTHRLSAPDSFSVAVPKRPRNPGDKQRQPLHDRDQAVDNGSVLERPPLVVGLMLCTCC